jgi:S-DNA-T family DNA segregation ATPase FtsK/SpoIIIE
LQSKLVQSVLTPNSALLKFAGSANLTVEQVLRRRSEFLTTHGINIVSVTPEPGLVSIAVERPHRQLVQIQDIWNRWQPKSAMGNQELLIGVREDNGELLFISPGSIHAPHTLIAGSTGSGKSVLMQNLVLGIAATNTPSYARIVLIDPKQGVDYLSFEGLPHLQGGIIDEQGTALGRLRDLTGEMDSRYTKLKASRSNSLAAYNQKVPEEERLPVIWVIHDEFAEWMLVEDYKEEVTSLVSRLGVKARAAGIHLVFAAQRPDANVMPMQLRANLGNRLILRVDAEGTSEIALGERGAEHLLGRGHLLAKLEGSPLCYAQVPYVDAEFMERIVGAIRNGQARYENAGS